MNLELKNIFLEYSYKKVLNGVSFLFKSGNIYALLGENGAGKSSLANILCGKIKQKSGEIFFNEKKLNLFSQKKSIDFGIRCVEQRPLLVNSLSIKDNFRLINQKIKFEEKNELFEKWLGKINLNTKITDLTDEQKFNVSIVNALLTNPKVLILDEPTFFPLEKLTELKKTGMIIIVITHNIVEAITKTDFTILLKDGTIIHSKKSSEFSENEIKNRLYNFQDEFLEDSQKEFISCQIQEDVIFKLKQKNPKLGYIPTDKTFRASNPDLTIFQLLTANKTKLSQKELIEYSQEILQKADVKIKLNEKVSNLSGGMLQRLILQKQLSENPKLIFLFNPTKGLDIAATKNTFLCLEELSKKNVPVILG